MKHVTKSQLLDVMVPGSFYTVTEVRDLLALPTACYGVVASRLRALQRDGQVEKVGSSWRRR